jgi:hypothetical protein
VGGDFEGGGRSPMKTQAMMTPPSKRQRQRRKISPAERPRIFPTVGNLHFKVRYLVASPRGQDRDHQSRSLSLVGLAATMRWHVDSYPIEHFVVVEFVASVRDRIFGSHL